MTRPESMAVESLAEPVFNAGQARAEAWRCLQCFDAPCSRACPAGIVIPRFIRMIRSGNLLGAAEVVRSANPLAHSCGLACPDEQLCGARCLRGSLDRPVSIRRLHRYATEAEEAAGARQARLAPPNRRHVAVVGSGPAGLACASELRRRGIRVTVFERRDRLGGVLGGSIPLYRFPSRTVLRDASWSLGLAVRELAAARNGQTAGGEGSGAAARVRFVYSRPVVDIQALSREFDAVFWATGLSRREDPLPGCELPGVLHADEFLHKCRLMRYRNPVGSEVAVMGGGNVACDAAMAATRCALERTGRARSRRPPRPPLVRLLYRRTRAEMPAWDREVEELARAGVVLQFLTIPLGFVERRGKLAGVRLCRATLGPKDAGGRPRPLPIAGSEYVIPCDTAILATGMKPDRTLLRKAGTSAWTRQGLLRVDPDTLRVRGKIFAGGDLVSPEQTIVAAVRDGKKAARSIARFLGES